MQTTRPALCILLASFCVLLFEIAITRVLSVVLWYHWAFLAVSLAMLGLGAPGVYLSLRPPRAGTLHRLLLAASVLIPLSVIAILRANHWFVDAEAGWDLRPVFSMVCFLPAMLCLGGAVCVLLLQARGPEIGRIYGFDLLGACLAAMIVIPALHVVPTPELTAGIGFVTLAAAWVAHGRPAPIGLGIACVLIAAMAWGTPFDVAYGRHYDETDIELLHEEWTPTARLAFFERCPWEPDLELFAWGLGTEAPRSETEFYFMTQDGGAGTPVTRFEGDFAELEHLLYDVTSVAYQLAEPRKVAIIGAGGGRDILTARITGAESVDAVEIHGAIVETLSTEFAEFSHDVYHLEGVRPVVSEGRSFLSRAEDRYDLIQISLIDSWAATAAGAFALSENNLYTLEAYRTYWRRLSDDGIVTTSRWATIELLRLLLLHAAALRAEGIDDPGAHLAVVHAGQAATVMLSRRQFTEDDLERLRTICARRGFALQYPTDREDPVAEWVRTAAETGNGPLGLQGFDLSVPTDDRPFFFQMVPLFGDSVEDEEALTGGMEKSVRALEDLMLAMIATAAAMFFIPFLTTRWMRRARGFWRGSGYFAAIGIGFMLIELPSLQRFILFLGHPSFATTVVLATLLLGAGLGSLASARIGVSRLQRWGLVLPIVLAAFNAALPTLFEVALAWPEAARVALATVLLIPIGVLLGLFFPLGMVRFGDANKAWFWAMNGVFSVVASVLSLALALELGFRNVIWIGIGWYVLAWVLLLGRPRPGR